jgi:hypothetical protein
MGDRVLTSMFRVSFLYKMAISITVEFSGGLEALFGNERIKPVEVAENTSIENLLSILKRQMTDPREDMFLQDGLV